MWSMITKVERDQDPWGSVRASRRCYEVFAGRVWEVANNSRKSYVEIF